MKRVLITVILGLSVAFNCGAETYFEYENPGITDVNLDYVTPNTDITLTTLKVPYKGYVDLSNHIYNVVFASATGDLSDVAEAGFEIDGMRYKISEKNFPSFLRLKTYGIGLCDIKGIFEDVFVAKPYIILKGGGTLFGEEVTIDKKAIESRPYAEWSDRENIYTLQGTEWRFYPEDNYRSSQNPPDFSWPYVEDAISYDLIISKDRDFGDVYASMMGLTVNYYNFSYAFDEDVYYYKVRFNTGKKLSRWSEPRRFTIKSGATEFIVDDIDTMLSKIPKEHPRIAVNPAVSEDFKNLKNGEAYYYYINLRNTTNNYIQSNTVVSEPATNEDFEEAAYEIGAQCTVPAIIYYLDNDAEAGQYAKRALLSLAGWDINGTSSYISNDLRFRDLVYYMGFSYTYIRDLLSEEERQTVLNAIKARAYQLINPPEGGVMDSIGQLKYSPYMSHGGSAVRHLLQTAICTYGDMPEAEEWLRKYLPMYINYFPNWGYQDGGWSQGTGYGNGVLVDGEDLRYTLMIDDMINIYEKPFFKNYYNNFVYNLGKAGYKGAPFGDQATGEVDSSWALAASNNARTTGNRYASWFRTNSGASETGAFSGYYMKSLPMPKTLNITFLPKAHYFNDIGLVSMLSDMNIGERCASYFKSGSYGSHNHSHADQNTFAITRNGKNLAIDSGYYDAYGSSHYSNYYKMTYAHNGITYNGGKGQTTYAMCANGNITNYINSTYFDLASGDAKNAYNFVYNPQTKGYIEKSIFDKMDRHFIYIRPDAYIVIDNIKFSNDQTGSLEWWLNADNFASYTDSSAVIDNQTDKLYMNMQYPKDTAATKYEGYVTPDNKPIKPNVTLDKESDRICFKKDNVNAQRFVATMSISGVDDEKKPVASEISEGIIRLTFADGTIAYVSENGGKIFVNGIESDGICVVYKNGVYMMVDGTYLKVSDNTLISSDKVISAEINTGEKTFSLSSNREDAKVTVYGVFAESYKDEYGNYYTNKINDGVSWQANENGMVFTLLKGCYSFKY